MNNDKKLGLRYYVALGVAGGLLGRTIFLGHSLDWTGFITLAFLIGLLLWPDAQKLTILGLLELKRNTREIVRTTGDIQGMLRDVRIHLFQKVENKNVMNVQTSTWEPSAANTKHRKTEQEK